MTNGSLTKKERMELVRSRMNWVRRLDELMSEDEILVQGKKETMVSALVTDSRRVTPGCAFFAMPGLRTNGNNFIKDAIQHGASTVITESNQGEIPKRVTKIWVNDARKALAKYAKKYHGNPDSSLNLVGVTGTNGKTTVTTLVRYLLEEPGKPVGLIGTVRYNLGDREILYLNHGHKNL